MFLCANILMNLCLLKKNSFFRRILTGSFYQPPDPLGCKSCSNCAGICHPLCCCSMQRMGMSHASKAGTQKACMFLMGQLVKRVCVCLGVGRLVGITSSSPHFRGQRLAVVTRSVCVCVLMLNVSVEAKTVALQHSNRQ